MTDLFIWMYGCAIQDQRIGFFVAEFSNRLELNRIEDYYIYLYHLLRMGENLWLRECQTFEEVIEKAGRVESLEGAS